MSNRHGEYRQTTGNYLQFSQKVNMRYHLGNRITESDLDRVAANPTFTGAFPGPYLGVENLCMVVIDRNQSPPTIVWYKTLVLALFCEESTSLDHALLATNEELATSKYTHGVHIGWEGRDIAIIGLGPSEDFLVGHRDGDRLRQRFRLKYGIH